MSSSEAGDTPQSYTFVTENNSGESRSHAIRAHWRQRRQRIESQRREREAQEQRPLRPILPSPGNPNESRTSPMSITSASHQQPREIHEDDTASSNHGSPKDPQAVRSSLGVLEGIPAQILSRMNIALGASRLDPFDRFPVQLTPRHHRLLHHWLSTFAGMMFNMHMSEFNPMRDVWLPLDLSNAASFNAIMAHSAAHLACMQSFSVPNEAMRFKIEAVGIVQGWARDPALALSDDTIAAILRLLSFERLWGSEVEWRIHHNGLLQIIEARGGITTLHNNWRLMITTFLAMSSTTLMSRPSWFDSSNQLREISQHPPKAHPILGNLGNLHKTRCLWLLSFIQDLRTFMGHSSEIYNHGLVAYTSIRDAVLVVKSDLCLHGGDTLVENSTDERERARLACLFYICVMLQGCVLHSDAGSSATVDFHHSYSITSFDQCLARNHAEWQETVQSLFECIFNGTIATQTPSGRLRYALDLTDILSSMSSEARRGVERCLLQILHQALTEERTTINYDWTLDSLLACIEGY